MTEDDRCVGGSEREVVTAKCDCGATLRSKAKDGSEWMKWAAFAGRSLDLDSGTDYMKCNSCGRFFEVVMADE